MPPLSFSTLQTFGDAYEVLRKQSGDRRMSCSRFPYTWAGSAGENCDVDLATGVSSFSVVARPFVVEYFTSKAKYVYVS